MTQLGTTYPYESDIGCDKPYIEFVWKLLGNARLLFGMAAAAAAAAAMPPMVDAVVGGGAEPHPPPPPLVLPPPPPPLAIPVLIPAAEATVDAEAAAAAFPLASIMRF